MPCIHSWLGASRAIADENSIQVRWRQKLACSFELVLPAYQGWSCKNCITPQCMKDKMTTLWHSITLFFQMFRLCSGRVGVSSAAAGLRLATNPSVMAMKSSVDFCKAICPGFK